MALLLTGACWVNHAPAAAPTLSLASPVNNAVFHAGLNLTLVAGVTNGAGATVTNVEFFQGASKVAETAVGLGNLFRASWSNVAAGSYVLRAVARANDGLSSTSAPAALTLTALASYQVNLVPAESVWKYLDNGTDQGTAWRGTNFNESAWASGPAQLGYGDGDEVTRVEDNPVAGYNVADTNRYITTYFRRTFLVANASLVTNLLISALHDDGIAVYLNGAEVFRRNLAAGAAYTDVAPTAVSGLDESINFYSSTTNGSLLVNGTNLLAVEIHQSGASSSDISFDLELIGDLASPNVLPSVSIVAPASGAILAAPGSNFVSVSASDPDGSIARVDMYTNGVFHRSVSAAPYEWVYTNLVAGSQSYRAIAVDNRDGMATSAIVSITVTGNVPPTASITLPANATAFSAPADVVINASAADMDGAVAKVEFYRGGAKIGEDLSNPFSYTNSGVGNGSYQLTVVATDNAGTRSATSGVVNITVSANNPPIVALTNPPNNASFSAPASIVFGANATDPEGPVSSVSFYSNGGLVGTDTTSPFSFNWNSVGAGSYALTAVATDPGGLTTTSAVVSITVTNPPGAFTNVLIGSNSVWRYLDDGSDQNTAWRALGFNDAAWPSGAAQLGFGDGDETTLIANNGQVTTYFRQKFILGNAAAYTNLSIWLLRDDGGVVYLNGIEIFRSPNMVGTILFNTVATGPAAENTVDTATLASVGGLLVDGPNIVAVEIHQQAVISSDVSFDFQLVGVAGVAPPNNAPPSVTLTNPANSATFASPANITLQATAADSDGSVVQVDFYRNGVLIGSDVSSPFGIAWNGVTAGSYSLTAVAIDNGGAATTSAPVNITVTGVANVPPTVNITSPANNTTTIAPSTVILTANAADSDGNVTRVDFYRGAVLVGTDVSSPFSIDWTNALVGAFQLSAIATDNNGATGTSAPISITFTGAAPSVLIALGSVWSYLDNGTNLAPYPWTAAGFNDSAWASGPAELGYGDITDGRPEATVVGFGPDSNSKYITTYFRRRFNVGNPAAYSALTFRTVRDDGAVVYLNGVEQFRLNMPGGAVNSSTLAASAISGSDEAAFYTNNAAASGLVSGENVVAVEIHQFNGMSSDISFELELIGNTGAIVNNPPAVALTSPSGGTVFTAPGNITLNASASDSDGSVSKVEFFANGAKLGEDSTAPYSFTWSGVSVGAYSFVAVATDNLGTSVTSAPPVNVSVIASSAPTLLSRAPAPGLVNNLTAITLTFSEPVDGVDARDLLINNLPASSVTSTNSTQFVFAFPQPMDGPVAVRFAPGHGIVDREAPPKAFDETATNASWQYSVADTIAPAIASIDPLPNGTVRALTQVTVSFTEAVGGVNATDLRLNGVGATSVKGFGAGPYVFNFTQPTIANPLAIFMQWTNTHGISDFAAVPNPFTGTNWTYSLNTNYVQTNIVINEIMYHPSSELASEEYIELYNRGSSSVKLAGWHLSGAVSFTFPNVTLNTNSYLIVAANAAAFAAKYPGVTNVFGGWLGQLSNNDDDIRLDDPLGQRVDSVHYADDGDWALRRVSAQFPPGWQWLAEHDGLGKSLELINPALPNEYGQNWSASVTVNGTPGRTNSVLSTNIAPLIIDTAHAPAVPRSTDPVTITTRLIDENAGGFSATLFWRVGGGAFTSTPMFDDGLHGDGLAGDGVHGVLVPPQAHLAVVEFYIRATDSGARARTWPGPTDSGGTQGANALYQVSDEVISTNQPIYRVVMTTADTATLDTLNNSNPGINVEMNGSFVTSDATGTEIRYTVGVRHRGAGSRGVKPPNLRLKVTSDRRWKGVTGLNLNTQYTHSQLAGSVLSRKAGLTSEEAIAVQVRYCGTNGASSGSPQYGSYVHMEARDSDWAANHFPLDPKGNLYTCTRPGADLSYQGASASSYLNAGYLKDSNGSENDYSDIMRLTATLQATPQLTMDANYVAAVRQVLDVGEWMRYFAVLSLLGYNETAIGSDGAPDDYSMYRGFKDTRFLILPHDHDTVLNQGDTPFPLNPANPVSVFRATANAQVNRFLKFPDFAPLYFAELYHQATTSFVPTNVNKLLDDALGTWAVPAQVITGMKNFAAARRLEVLSQIPLSLTVTPASLPPVVSGFYKSATAALSLDGRANAIHTRSIRVGGQLASWTPWQASWSGGATLRPGINRVVIQAFDAADVELERTVLDVWYDDGSIASVSGVLPANTTWSAVGGPYQVTGNLTVGAGVTLVIEPGTTIYLNSGVTMTVNGTGRLLAEGTEGAHIRFTRVPGAVTTWGSLDFSGATIESRLAFVDFDSCAGTTIGGHAAELHVNNSRVFFDHLTFANVPAQQYISFDASSFIVQNSLFPTYPFAVSGPEMLHGVNGIPAGGRGIFRGNYFGHTYGFNDTIDFTGGQRPGPILQILGNIFDGAGDDHLDLDSTDAWIEGNLFMHAHRDTNRTDNALDTASAISGGLDFAGQYSDWTIINNLFYDVDHAVLNKQGGRFTFVNNTLVHVNKENGSGLANDIGAFNFTDDALPLPDPALGAGAYIAGNIIWDSPVLAVNYNPANLTVIFENNLLPVPWPGPGSNNVVADPLLHLSLITNVLTADWRTVLAALTPRPGSPALGTGIGGFDKGGLNPRGILLSGEPAGKLGDSNATLTLGPGGTFNWGTNAYEWGYAHYKWKLDNGPWSAETSITTSPRLSFSNLPAGLHTVYVSGKNDADGYQDDPFVYPLDSAIPAHVTTSRSWIVNPMVPSVRLNEVLARNDSAVAVGSKFPDLVELFNPGSNAVSLAGMGLTDEPDQPFKFSFPGGTTLGPGQYLVLYADSDATPPGVHLGFSLKQNGDELFFTAPNGMVFDSVTFGPQLADRSIGRLPDGSWTLCQPTFGGLNVASRLGDPLALRINEWLASGYTPYPDDFIELFNMDPLPVPMGNLFLTDNPIGAPALHAIAPLSFIAGGGYALFIADGNPSTGADHVDFKLRSEQGMIGLMNADLSMIDCVIYGPQLNDVSMGRQPNGSPNYGFFSSATPGGPNPGIVAPNTTIVLNEVLSLNLNKKQPDGSTPDWVEFYNPTASSIDMGDMSLTDNAIVPRKYVFPAGSIVPAGGFRSFRCDPDIPAGTNNTGFGLKSTGQSVLLFDKLSGGGSLLSSVSYGVQAADFSIGRIPNGGSNWMLCVESIGANNVAVSLGIASNLKVNEWMANPNGGDDWFEIFNPYPQPVALGGLFLSDDVTTPATRMKHPIAPLSFIGIGAYGFQRFEADGNLAAGPEHVNFSLKIAGEQLGISSASGSLIDGLTFNEQALGVSEGRLPDGGSVITNFPGTASPGDPNYILLTSVAINEALTHTDPPLEDAIELLDLRFSINVIAKHASVEERMLCVKMAVENEDDAALYLMLV